MSIQTADHVSARRRHGKIILLLAVLIVIGLAGILAFVILRNRCNSVGEVWKYARILDGARICVVGKGVTDVSQTLALCDPPSCNCNQSNGYFYLVSEEEIVRNPGVSYVDSVIIYPSICTGDQCTITCSPIDPFAAEYYRFVGRLSITYLGDGRMVHLKLVDIDLPASRELVNGDWQPIPTGVFPLQR